jgi:bifunctional UDP-N-acetylglucosamine pyrophosphorylase/glucosamine-1-phosphate N-acetyltransferase
LSQTRLSALVVLAAGEGTRMKSATPKVLHKMLGRTLLGHVLAATDSLAAGTTLIVVGHGKDEVVEHVQHVAPSAGVVEQAEQRGTGNAVAVALTVLPNVSGSLMVVCGDTPLLTSETLQRLCAVHDEEAAAATVLTSRAADPFGYGRVVRGGDGTVAAIVEEADADEQTRAVKEVNSGIYVFDGPLLREALSRLSRDNSQGEEYLTDVVAILVEYSHIKDPAVHRARCFVARA